MYFRVCNSRQFTAASRSKAGCDRDAVSARADRRVGVRIRVSRASLNLRGGIQNPTLVTDIGDEKADAPSRDLYAGAQIHRRVGRQSGKRVGVAPCRARIFTCGA